MADCYQDRPFPTDAEHVRDAVRGECGPLAELAQLTGQSDPFGTTAKKLLPLQSRANVRPQYAPAEAEASAPAGSPPRMQRTRQESPPQQEYEEPEPKYLSPVPPLHRYAAPEQDHREPQDEQNGVIKSVEQENVRDPAYPDDPYAHQRGFGRMVAIAAVLALALVGTGAALTYRAYVGSPRSGELPIATNVVPAQSDGGASKIPDRMPPGYGGEKLASRDEAPVDVSSSSGASLVVLPPLNQNSSPPPVAGPALATDANGTMPNNQPRMIKTLAVKGDAAEYGGIPASAAAPAKPDPARSASAPAAPAQRNSSANNVSANAPPTVSPPIRRRRSVSPPLMPSGRLLRRAAIIWFKSPPRRTRPTYRLPTAPCKTSFRLRWGPVRRSSGAPISATRGSITAPWSARSDPPKRLPSSAAL